MAVSIDDIKKLRAMTGAGLADVKKALTEAEGDFDKAKDLLRERGLAIAAKRSDLQRMCAREEGGRLRSYRGIEVRDRLRG